MCVYSGDSMQEFGIAYYHNISVKRKKRLIVLMMLDRPNELHADDANSNTVVLRQYLRQYTYIDYNSDDWLDKLLYALPLRGLLQPNQRPDDGTDEDPNLHDNDEMLMVPTAEEHQSSFGSDNMDVPLLSL